MSSARLRGGIRAVHHFDYRQMADGCAGVRDTETMDAENRDCEGYNLIRSMTTEKEQVGAL
jgi:hypothetical protein